MSSSEVQSYKDYVLELKGAIGFDENGREVLINDSGQAFAMDETIKDIWKELERVLRQPGKYISTMDELWKELPFSKNKKNETYKVLEKLLHTGLLRMSPQ